MKIRNQTDTASGLFFIILGGGFAAGASNYRLGSAANMGPGYFPFWVGLALAAIGAVVLIHAFRDPQPKPISAWDIRGLLLVLLSVVLFGLLIRTAGLVVTISLVALVSSFAGRDVTWKATLVTIAVALVISVAIFSYILGLQIPVWPTLFGD
ncbi:tripartite tricarboxylate transporter TctB family protein [Pseudochelatococcus sp. B33]